MTVDRMTDRVNIKKQQRGIEGIRQKWGNACSTVSSPAISSILTSQNLTLNLVQQGPKSHTADIQIYGCSLRSFNYAAVWGCAIPWVSKSKSVKETYLSAMGFSIVCIMKHHQAALCLGWLALNRSERLLFSSQHVYGMLKQVRRKPLTSNLPTMNLKWKSTQAQSTLTQTPRLLLLYYYKLGSAIWMVTCKNDYLKVVTLAYQGYCGF